MSVGSTKRAIVAASAFVTACSAFAGLGGAGGDDSAGGGMDATAGGDGASDPDASASPNDGGVASEGGAVADTGADVINTHATTWCDSQVGAVFCADFDRPLQNYSVDFSQFASVVASPSAVSAVATFEGGSPPSAFMASVTGAGESELAVTPSITVATGRSGGFFFDVSAVPGKSVVFFQLAFDDGQTYAVVLGSAGVGFSGGANFLPIAAGLHDLSFTIDTVTGLVLFFDGDQISGGASIAGSASFVMKVGLYGPTLQAQPATIVYDDVLVQ